MLTWWDSNCKLAPDSGSDKDGSGERWWGSAAIAADERASAGVKEME